MFIARWQRSRLEQTPRAKSTPSVTSRTRGFRWPTGRVPRPSSESPISAGRSWSAVTTVRTTPTAGEGHMFGWFLAYGYAGWGVAGRTRSGARRERSRLRCKATVARVVRVNGAEVSREDAAIVERVQDGLGCLPRLRPIDGAACSRHVLRAMSALGHMARRSRASPRVPWHGSGRRVRVCQLCANTAIEASSRRSRGGRSSQRPTVVNGCDWPFDEMKAGKPTRGFEPRTPSFNVMSFRGLLQSLKSGEGWVFDFSGPGRVCGQTRSPQS